MLKAGGLAHDAESAAAGFKAFCQAWRDGHQDEPEPLFIHVGQEVWDGQDAPPVVPELLDDYDPHAPRPAFSLLGIKRSSVSTTDEGSSKTPSAQYDPRPQGFKDDVDEPVRDDHEATADGLPHRRLPRHGGQAAAFVGAMPASLEEIDADRLERRLAAITPSPSQLSVLGLRLDPDARGVCFADIERTALALGAQAQLLPGHEVLLSSAFGSRHCRSFAECCKLLNGRTYGAIDG
jgi:hypothetical protein